MANLKRINELPDATEFSASDKMIIDTVSGVKKCSADTYNGKCDLIIRVTTTLDGDNIYELIYGNFQICSTILNAANRTLVGIICGENSDGHWQQTIGEFSRTSDGSIYMESYSWSITLHTDNVVD